MVGKRKFVSPIPYTEVNDTFNERFKWAKYSSVYHPSVTTYYWNKYNVKSTSGYAWDRYNVTYSETSSSTIGHHGSDPTSPNMRWFNGGWSSFKIENLKYVGTGTSGGGFAERDQVYPNGPIRYCIKNYGSPNGSDLGTSVLITITESHGNYAGYAYISGTEKSRTLKKSSSFTQVTSTSSTAYPTNTISGSYYYTNQRTTTLYSKGTTHYGEVSSTSRSAYPNNAQSGSYWYVYARSTTSSAYYTQGSFIEEVKSIREDEYPENGRGPDGYWYK